LTRKKSLEERERLRELIVLKPKSPFKRLPLLKKKVPAV